MKPTVGRIVHYVSYGSPVRADGTQAFRSLCRAAVITEVQHDSDPRGESPVVGLCVLNPTGLFFHPLSDGGCVEADPALMVGGSWHWPCEIVEET